MRGELRAEAFPAQGPSPCRSSSILACLQPLEEEEKAARCREEPEIHEIAIP